MVIFLHIGWPMLIRSPRTCRDVVIVSKPPEVLDAVTLDNGVDRLASRLDICKACATAAASVEGLDWRLDLGHSGSKRHLSRFSMANRAHYQTALAPLTPPALDLHAHGDLALIPLGDKLRRPLFLLSPHRAQGLLTAPHSFQGLIQLPLGQVHLRQRTQRVIPRQRNEGPRVLPPSCSRQQTA